MQFNENIEFSSVQHRYRYNHRIEMLIHEFSDTAMTKQPPTECSKYQIEMLIRDIGILIRDIFNTALTKQPLTECAKYGLKEKYKRART